MTMLEFSDEAKLYSKEYVVVKEVEKAWRADLERFHNALFVRISKQLEDLRSSGKSEYKYWYLKSWDVTPGPLYVWQPPCYPELLRDNVVELFLYYSDDKTIWETVHPELQSQAKTVLGAIGGLKIEVGKANSYRPVTLRVSWNADPLEETAPVLVETIQALDGIVPTLQSLANAGKKHARKVESR